MKCVWLLVICAIGVAICIEHDFKGFDDSILFGINWPGPQEVLENIVDGEQKLPEQESNKEILKVLTADKEGYECHIPELKATESTSIEEYDGPSPLKLLKPLISQKICSFRLESYWSYEVCHGQYVRQYHEEREGKHVKTQEYYLGYWKDDENTLHSEKKKPERDPKEIPRTTKVEGMPLPYVEMVMEGGTVCDLSGQPRRTRILYVCYSHGKHEVYSFKETSTCEYEIIILCPLLCDHPQFKPKEISENAINCMPIGDAPKKPRSLLKQEVDSLRFHHQSVRLINNNDKDAKDVLAVLKVERVEKDGETHLKFELHPLAEEGEAAEDTKKPRLALPEKAPVISDDSPVRAFLNGEDCLNGGSGWWKYEFCYGRHVSQYHVDRAGGRTSVLLGRFDEAAHLEWIQENKGKAPKPIEFRTSISHFYSNGDVCDKTDKPRQTEVKLKCLENSSSPAQVSLYLLEPRTCHYILGVESPLICDILPFADENGLIKQAKPLDVTNKPKDDVEKEEAAEDTKETEVPKIGND